MDPRVLSLLHVLDRHSWDTPFREKDLARKTGLSTGHLDRLFVRDLGATPRAYRQKRRLENARALLADQSIPVKKIACDLGFSSPAHFSHRFRNVHGKSPRQIRHKTSGGILLPAGTAAPTLFSENILSSCNSE
jgi:AraC family transcriptional regulator